MDNRTDKLQACLQKFINHVSELENEEDPAGNGFHKDYRVLRDLASKNKEDETFPAAFGKLPYNVKKNRYRDIVPYDSHRVTLDEIPNTEGSDYINASFIEGPMGRAAYIASQGPLPHTLNDYWRMLWQYKVKVVIMACKEVEMGKKKCACYWPENASEEATFNDIRVKLVNESNLANADDCIERCMDVYKGTEGPLRITQFQYTGWPDHGIPDDVDVILEMIAKMRVMRQRDKDFAPVVVHCSAGCGRTGTICAIDYAWELLKTGRLEENFNLYEIIKRMREQRQSMIQTPEQYMMAHIAIRDLFLKHIDVIEGNVYANVENQDEYYNANVEDASSSYSDIKFDETYSYVEPKQLLEREVISIVSIYSDAASLDISNSNPPLSPKPQIDVSKKPLPQIDNSPPSLPEKQPKDQSPKPVKRTSKNILNERKEEELLRGKTSDKPENYLNVFKGDRYVNVDTPLKQDPENIPPPKPPLTRVPSGKNSMLPAGPSGPTFVKTSPGPSRKPAIHATKQNNTQSQTAGKFVSSITVGSGGQATNLVSSGGSQGTTSPGSSDQTKHLASSLDKNKKLPDMPNKKIPETDIYSLASNVKAEEPIKLENKGPVFKQSTGGDVYAQVSKSGGNVNPASNMEYSEVSKQKKPVHPGLQNKGGDSVYESIGTNGEYRPTPSSPTGGVYEDVLALNNDSLYSLADPVRTDPDVPQIPERGYRDNDTDNRDYSQAKVPTTESTTTLGRIKQKYHLVTEKCHLSGMFKGSSDTNVDTSDIPGYKKRLGKAPKGKREKPSLWDKIKL